MRFWDSSAIVSLVVEEPCSAACRRLLRASPGMVVWAFTRTELVSAIYRKWRQRELATADVATALSRIDLLAKRWTEVNAIETVRDRAERLLAVHPLRAADALQLAAALALVDERPRRTPFVTADRELAMCAEREGFAAVVPE